MNIAIIGTGNVGGALAAGWANVGHNVRLGVRDTQNFKGVHLLELENILALPISDAVAQSDVVLIAAAPQFTQSIVEAMGSVDGKIIIDAMNSVRSHPDGFSNSFEALTELTKGAEIVKCFNSTGFENMADPMYDGVGADMFVAGNSVRGKEVAKKLSRDLGFAECFDFGGDEKVALLEQFALSWINLAIMQGHGRAMAFKVLKR